MMSLSRSEEKLFLRFMETTIRMVNSCMARIYMLEKLVVEKGIMSKTELKKLTIEAENHPKHIQNTKVLEEMVKEFNQRSEI